MSYISAYVSDTGSGRYREEEDPCGRVLTDAQFAERLRGHSDIFSVERNVFLTRVEGICLCVGCILCFLLPGMEITPIPVDFIAPSFTMTPTTTPPVVAVLRTPIERWRQQVAVVDRPPAIRHSHDNKSAGSGQRQRRNSGGDYRDRTLNKGVLGLVQAHVDGSGIFGDIFGKGGFSEMIDGLLKGPGGLIRGGDGRAGRKAGQSIGFGPGIGIGFDEGGGDVGSMLDHLMAPDRGAFEVRRSPVQKVAVLRSEAGVTRGGRSRNEIAFVVQQNMSALRYAYSRRLREKPGLRGKITVRFAIDEFGSVLFCDVVSSSMHDTEFERSVTSQITRWAFNKIDTPGDVTEVRYPFVFSL